MSDNTSTMKSKPTSPSATNATNNREDKKNAPEPLPLGWTRVRRKRPAPTAGDDDDECCLDPASCPRRIRPRAEVTSLSSNDDSPSNIGMIQGNVVFCMHDLNPSWVQGYFIPKGSNKPWGLLAVTEEIDDCLECADGGYRRVTITIFHHGRHRPSNGDDNKLQSRNKSNSKIKHVDWTGGDMMRLSHPNLTMETERLYTGKSALPYIDKYFQKLFQKLEKQQQEEDKDSDVSNRAILDWMPNVAIITGAMAFALPKNDDSDQ